MYEHIKDLLWKWKSTFPTNLVLYLAIDIFNTILILDVYILYVFIFDVYILLFSTTLLGLTKRVFWGLVTKFSLLGFDSKDLLSCLNPSNKASQM